MISECEMGILRTKIHGEGNVWSTAQWHGIQLNILSTAQCMLYSSMYGVQLNV